MALFSGEWLIGYTENRVGDNSYNDEQRPKPPLQTKISQSNI